MTLQLSVLIPTRNRRELLLGTLASLRAQDVGPEVFEVVVASDGSSDGTVEAVRDLARGEAWAGRGLVCVEQEWGGASAARNTALRAARGELVLYLDDDTRADPGLIAAHLRRHASSAGGQLAVLGHIEVEDRPEAIHRQLRRWWRDHYRRLAEKEVSFTAFFTGNVSLPREAGLAVGGLDESIDYAEDMEFGYRLRRHGLSFAYEPNAVASTRNPKAPAAVLRDLYRIGQGNVRIYHKFPEALRDLPLSAYGDTNLRMRLARGALLAAARLQPGAWLIDRLLATWAGSRVATRLDKSMFELARGYYFWQGVRAAADRGEWARLASPGVPVLTYHSVERSTNGREQRYTVDARSFRRQMALLKLLGYRVVPLDSLVETWERGELPPPGAAAVTFDDGYRDNMTVAWPALRRFGYPATLFFVSGLAGQESAWDSGGEVGAKPLLTWAEAKALDGAGFRVEAHTVSHPDLAAVAPEVAQREIAGSRRQIEEHLGRAPELFAYPYGHYLEETKKQVEAAGYRAAFSVRRGLNTLRTERFALRRVTISGDDSLPMVALKLWTGDDPLRYLPLGGRLTDRKWKRERRAS